MKRCNSYSPVFSKLKFFLIYLYSYTHCLHLGKWLSLKFVEIPKQWKCKILRNATDFLVLLKYFWLFFLHIISSVWTACIQVTRKWSIGFPELQEGGLDKFLKSKLGLFQNTKKSWLKSKCHWRCWQHTAWFKLFFPILRSFHL